MMLKKIVSFGFRHGNPVLQSDIVFVVIDVRQMFRNPFHDRTLRHLRGTDKAVQADILKTPEFEAKFQHLKEKVSVPGVEVAYIGCTGGRHRSVFLAERLGRVLGVPVEHRDLEKADAQALSHSR